jgi:hypothetical protein
MSTPRESNVNTIKNIPYIEAKFDKKGEPLSAVSIPAGTTDLFVMSHGWRNDEADATSLYTTFFTNFADPNIVPAAQLAGRQCAVIGVFWPSKNFDALIAAQGAGTATNAAAIGDAVSDPESQEKLVELIEALKRPFDEPAQIEALTAAQALVPDLDEKATARSAFIGHLRKLMDPSAANKEDASDVFLKGDPGDIFKRLNIPASAIDPSIPKTGRAMALAPGVGVAAIGHTAGLFDTLKGAAASASNAVGYLSYFMMKERSGIVGMKGVAPLIDKLAPQVGRIHLIGHSFGARVVAAAALASQTDKIHSVSFLQAAFSHNGFSPAALMNGFFRLVIDKKRVKGALIATHTKNDTAVGIAYPLASRISGSVAAALGDENDKYGALGRNGAQQMNPGEAIRAELLAVGGTYQLTQGKIHNLLADKFIANHGDVTRPEVVAAVAAAAT